MPISPDEFYNVAKALSSRVLPVGEARDRTIAGRAYYAAFLAVRDSIRNTHGLPVDYQPSHEQLGNTLAAIDAVPDIKMIGTRLNTLRHLRIRADYKLHKSVAEDEADDAVEDADQILRALPAVADQLPPIPG